MNVIEMIFYIRFFQTIANTKEINLNLFLSFSSTHQLVVLDGRSIPKI